MSLDALLAQVETAASLGAKNRLVRDFAQANTSPTIEDTRVTFFHLSHSARDVAIEGDWTNWTPTASLSNLPDTPLWYRIERFPRAARLEYRIVVNGKRHQLDPHNPLTGEGSLGANSVAMMPDYVPPRELAQNYRGARGKLQAHWMNCKEMRERFTFWVYLPPRYDPKQKYPTTYWNDGSDYLRYGALTRILDYLIGTNEIQPCLAVLIKPNDRRKEYACNNPYARFLAQELVPWVDSRFRTLDEPGARAIIGASLGALAAAHAARRHPNVFGLVGGQSGVYGFQNDALIRDYGKAENLPMRFHLIVGDYETDLHGTGKSDGNLVAGQQRFTGLLQQKGYEVFSATFPEGHQWGFWRAHIGDMLRLFFPN